jgi:ADP-heptose:LPS heptosyltransferase
MKITNFYITKYKFFLLKLIFFIRNSFTFLTFCLYKYFDKKLTVNLERKTQFSILVIRLDKTVGDSIMNSSFIRELRAHYKKASISLCANESVRDLYENCPYVDRLIYFKNDQTSFFNLVFREFFLIHFFFKNFRKSNYDLVIVPRLDYDHCAIPLAYLTQASRRLGYSEKATYRKSILNVTFNHFLTDIVESINLKHEVEANLFLLNYLGIKAKSDSLEIWVNPRFRSYAMKVFNNLNISRKEKFVIALGLSGGHSKLKEWPIEHYVQLAELIQREWQNKNIYFLLLGSVADFPSASFFKKKLPSSIKIIDMVGQTSIQESAALMRESDYFVGNDSGLLHVAAACNVPTIGIFGSSCYHRFGAWGKRSKSVSVNLYCCPCNQEHQIDRCSSCIHKEVLCMTKITPQRVLNELISL